MYDKVLVIPNSKSKYAMVLLEDVKPQTKNQGLKHKTTTNTLESAALPCQVINVTLKRLFTHPQHPALLMLQNPTV
jgi:hypothetical protein